VKRLSPCRSRRSRAAGLVAVTTILLSVGVAAPAAAARAPGPGQLRAVVAAPAGIAASSDGCGAADGTGTLAGADSNLAINRWADVADSFHDRLDGDLWNDVIEKIQRRAVYSTMLSTGNAMWQASSTLVSFATRFCLLDTLGADADRVAAAVGGAFLGDGGPLLAAIIAAALAVAVWRQARGRGPAAWRGVARSGLLIAVMAVMVAGASRTTMITAPEDGSTFTDFGTGSPGWVATRVNGVIAALGSAPAKAIADQGSVQEQAGDTGDPLSCSAVTANLRANYTDLHLAGPGNLGASVPLVMSQMWENTGLMVWVNSQFGRNNPYGQRVYCHVLEDRVNTTRWSQSNTQVPTRTAGFGPSQGTGNGTVLGLMLDGNPAGIPDVNGDAAAWDFRGDNSTQDAAVIGWAACRWDGDWTVDPQWARVDSGGDSGGGNTFDAADSGNPISPDDCRTWWTDPGADITGTAMDFEDNPGHIRAATAAAPAVGDFLGNWHGNDNSAAFALAFAFDLSSLIMLLVFGGIALGIIVAKVAMVVMIALVIIALVASLWITPGSTRLASYAKFYVGLAVFTFGISALFALLNLITGFLVSAGARQFGPGSILAVLWSGFAPVTAVVVLHLLFKHVLRMPSPFKPSGALAYAGAIGGIGAAAGAGFDRLLTRARYRGEYRARQYARTSLGSGRGRPGHLTRPGSMAMHPAAHAPHRRDHAPTEPTPAGTAAEVRAARRFVRTGQHLPQTRLAADTRDWAGRTADDARSAWRTFFDRNRTDPADRGDWRNLTGAGGATARAATAAVGHRGVLATVGRGAHQIDRAKTGLTRARAAAGNAVDDLRTRPVRTALAAGGVTLAAATVGAPLVAGATGVVLARRALRAHTDHRAARPGRDRRRDAEYLRLHAQHAGPSRSLRDASGEPAEPTENHSAATDTDNQ